MADSDFGKEVGLVHKAIITGRKVGAGKEFWTALADNEGLFRNLMSVQEGTHRVVEIPLLTHARTFTTTNAKPTIARKSDQFKNWFDGVEDGERAPELTLRKLERGSVDEPIIAASVGNPVPWDGGRQVLSRN